MESMPYPPGAGVGKCQRHAKKVVSQFALVGQPGLAISTRTVLLIAGAIVVALVGPLLVQRFHDCVLNNDTKACPANQFCNR